jgi:hypothetical protein
MAPDVDSRGISSRAVLLALAIAAVAAVAALFALMGTEPRTEPQISDPTAPPPKSEPRGALEGTAGQATERTDAPEAEARRTNPPPGGRKLGVQGTVVDARTRAGVPGVDVEAVLQPRAGGEAARGKAVTDAQGRYAIDLPPASGFDWSSSGWVVQVTASGDRCRPVQNRLPPARFPSDPAVEGGAPAVCDFEVQLLLALRGRIVSEPGDVPIVGATATLLRTGEEGWVPQPIVSAKTDEGGRFLIQTDEADPDHVAVLGTASGYLGKLVPAVADPSRAVDLGDIALGQGACLEGIVATANGSPPLATEIIASRRAGGSARLFLDADTWELHDGAALRDNARGAIGADGRFSLCGLSQGAYDLRLAYAGCRTASSTASIEVRAPATGLSLQVSEAVYRLKVSDARNGQRIPRARFVFDEPAGLDCWIEGNNVVATDAGVESPGVIVAEGYRSLRCTLPALAASEVRDLDFRLQVMTAQVACLLVVKSPQGAPVEHVEVEIRGDAGELEEQGALPRMAHSAPDGVHELPKLAPGTYRIEVEPDREANPGAGMWLGTTLEVRVREGMDPVEVRLEEGGLVQVSVVKAAGGSVDARTWLLRTPSDPPEPIDWVDDAGGIFGGWIPENATLHLREPLAAGRWTLRFEAIECLSKDVEVFVEAGKRESIQVALDPASPR